jgi:hypothetical protein
MIIDTQNFESRFGFELPNEISKLLNDDIFKKKVPIRFRLKNHSFLFEIQYLLDISDVKNFDIDERRLKFAVTPDGFQLLIDLNSKRLDVLQDEFGDIDSLGISIIDLIESEKESI